MRYAVLLLLLLPLLARAEDDRDRLWDAARRGDAKAVKELLARRVDVNARTRYGATALWFAAYKGRHEVVQLLLASKADPNIADTVWATTPLALAASENRLESVKLLLEAGARGADSLVLSAASQGESALLQALIDHGKPRAESLSAALVLARGDAVKSALKKAGAKPPPQGSKDEQKTWQALSGSYETDSGARAVLTVRDGVLLASLPIVGVVVLRPIDAATFGALGHDATRITVESKDGKPFRLRIKGASGEVAFERAATTRSVAKPGPFKDEPADVRTPRNWPSFRGLSASGVADGQHPPATWDVKKPHPGMWKTEVPGLGHSCPVIWGDRVFVTTAVSSDPKSEFKSGLYGALTAAKDRSKHSWRVYCLDRKTGKVLWQRTAFEGVPIVKRHLKASHANATPVTDGKHLVVSFASEGLYCYDLDGKQLWKRDLGVLDAGAFNDPDAQWEAGSSPILHYGLVIMQCDRQKDSFLAAYRLDTGDSAWRTPRDEPPSWGTPTVFDVKGRSELVANGTNAIRGYDPTTGKEFWRLGRNAQITVPTPIMGDGLLFVTSGYRPIQPIYAIFPGATGDITLKDRQESSPHIAWSKVRGGPYMPTPIYYRGHLYTCANAGAIVCYEGRTGKEMYRDKLGGTNGYTASPVAADGRLYFTGEDGKVYVVAAGPAYRLLAVNDLGDTCLATPAISNGMIVFRTQKYVMGIGRP